jgi:membrane protein DedA with SNARE-associated domain
MVLPFVLLGWFLAWCAGGWWLVNQWHWPLLTMVVAPVVALVLAIVWLANRPADENNNG